MAGSKAAQVVPAPGAVTSPQIPGMTPDWSDLPAHVGEATPAAVAKVRPLTQYGTAEELADVFRKRPMDQMDASDFEQAPASYEEVRKADPANLTPIRPVPPIGTERAISAGDTTRELTSGE